MVSEKWCPRCQQTLVASSFFANKRQPSGLNPYCKQCEITYRRLRRQGVTVEKIRPVTVFRSESGEVAEKICPKCKETLPASAFARNGAQPSGLTVYCKACWTEYQSGRSEYVTTYNRKSYAEHAEERRAIGRRYYANHVEEGRARAKAWREANPERFHESLRQRAQRIKLAALNAYGGPKCACCGEAIIGFLSLDHMDNDGAAHRKETGAGARFYDWLKRNGYPQDLKLQVLCFNCNLGKRVNGGICPHQEFSA